MSGLLGGVGGCSRSGGHLALGLGVTGGVANMYLSDASRGTHQNASSSVLVGLKPEGKVEVGSMIPGKVKGGARGGSHILLDSSLNQIQYRRIKSEN